jgi:hypothetical protein
LERLAVIGPRFGSQHAQTAVSWIERRSHRIR